MEVGDGLVGERKPVAVAPQLVSMWSGGVVLSMVSEAHN